MCRDFDSLLYLCLSIFGFLTFDVYERLTKGFVLPFYTLAHLGLLLVVLIDVIQQWRSGRGWGGGRGDFLYSITFYCAKNVVEFQFRLKSFWCFDS